MTCDLLIINATVLPISSNPIYGGFVAIRGEKILEVGAGSPNYTAQKVMDAAGHIVMPGMVNCHTHLPMTLYRGVGNDRCGIFKLMFPLEKACTTEEMCRVGAQLGAIELIHAGVTCFADMYYFEDAIAEVIDQVGLRAILGETILNFPAPDAKEPFGGFELAKNLWLSGKIIRA